MMFLRRVRWYYVHRGDSTGRGVRSLITTLDYYTRESHARGTYPFLLADHLCDARLDLHVVDGGVCGVCVRGRRRRRWRQREGQQRVLRGRRRAVRRGRGRQRRRGAGGRGHQFQSL